MIFLGRVNPQSISTTYMVTPFTVGPTFSIYLRSQITKFLSQDASGLARRRLFLLSFLHVSRLVNYLCRIWLITTCLSLTEWLKKKKKKIQISCEAKYIPVVILEALLWGPQKLTGGCTLMLQLPERDSGSPSQLLFEPIKLPCENSKIFLLMVIKGN